MKKSHILILIVLLVLVIDQATKIWVKTNMYIGEDSFENWSMTPNWARIHFVENDGMAFGIQIWGPYGKLILSLFRIVAVAFLIYFIRKLIESKASTGLLISFALILAGAIGNILDSAFYGLIFSNSEEHSQVVAQLFPEAGGYAGFLHGKVVDMLYFPLTRGYFPEWFPFWAGRYYEFFRPVFNVADVSISTGVISILLFQRSFFSSEVTKEDSKKKLIQEDGTPFPSMASDTVEITIEESDERKENESAITTTEEEHKNTDENSEDEISNEQSKDA